MEDFHAEPATDCLGGSIPQIHGYAAGRYGKVDGVGSVTTVERVIALARPQWGFDWEEVRQRGLDIVIAIDTSRSMLAEDVSPNRLTRAKL